MVKNSGGGSVVAHKQCHAGALVVVRGQEMVNRSSVGSST